VREAERIAEEYEEEAALPGPDAKDLVVRIRKLEERMATLEEYLGDQSAHPSP
jgi:hypothetical protein